MGFGRCRGIPNYAVILRRALLNHESLRFFDDVEALSRVLGITSKAFYLGFGFTTLSSIARLDLN